MKSNPVVDRLKADAQKPAELAIVVNLSDHNVTTVKPTWVGSEYVWRINPRMAVHVDKMEAVGGFTILDGSARLYRAWDGYLPRFSSTEHGRVAVLRDICKYVLGDDANVNQLATLLALARECVTSASSEEREWAITAQACAAAALSMAEAADFSHRMARGTQWNYDLHSQASAVLMYVQVCLNHMVISAGTPHHRFISEAYSGALACAEAVFSGINMMRPK